MTVIVGLNYLNELLVVADTRISFSNNTYMPREGVKKLLILGNVDKVAVIGFAGNISAAKHVYNYLITKQVNRRRFVISRFKDDLAKWIQEATTSLPQKAAMNLCFMFCALEPSRKVPVRGRKGALPFSWRECHIYTYQITPGRVQLHRHSPVAVIGSGKEQEANIRKKAVQLINFGQKMPNSGLVRSIVVSDVVSQLFQDGGSSTVGGPFQVVRIVPPPEVSQEIYVWPDPADSTIVVTHERNTTFMRSSATGMSYTLHSVWDRNW